MNICCIENIENWELENELGSEIISCPSCKKDITEIVILITQIENVI